MKHNEFYDIDDRCEVCGRFLNLEDGSCPNCDEIEEQENEDYDFR